MCEPQLECSRETRRGRSDVELKALKSGHVALKYHICPTWRDTVQSKRIDLCDRTEQNPRPRECCQAVTVILCVGWTEELLHRRGAVSL